MMKLTRQLGSYETQEKETPRDRARRKEEDDQKKKANSPRIPDSLGALLLGEAKVLRGFELMAIVST